jgi:LuxR family maltose regulon positive regulatory protein
VPSLRPGIVDRPALVDGLIHPGDQPVVLISAPTGYGKSTLLALWNERDERPFAWISLEPSHNDPVVLVADVLAALGAILDLPGDIGRGLEGPRPELEDIVLPSLAEACASADRSFVLVLQNVHLLTEARSLAVIRYLTERMPRGSQIALATQTDPAVGLASLRAHGELKEIRAFELALDDAEAAALMAAAGVELRPDQVARLVERAEGWPAAIYLAALSLRDREGAEVFVDRFAGTTRHVADYLSEDVLGRLSDEVVSFLLETSVLEELTASLCDAVTGRTDAEAQLRALERSNLFVVPLDEERGAYRYHHLFADYLRAESARTNADLIPRLHSRASRWYEDHGIIKRAIAHAVAAGEIGVAGSLVAGNWAIAAQRGQIETVRGWLGDFTSEQIAEHAPLAVAATWIAGLDGENEQALAYGRAALSGSWDGPMPDGSASLESAVAMMPQLAGVSEMRAAALRAVELEPPTSQWRSIALQRLGVAEALSGRFVDARAALHKAIDHTTGQNSTAGFSSAYLALVSLQEGDEEAAFAFTMRAHAIADRPGMRSFMPSIAGYGITANLLSRRGDLDGAARAAEHAIGLLPKVSDVSWWQQIVTRIVVAPALGRLGRYADAQEVLKGAAAVLAHHPDAGVLPDWYTDALHEVHPHRREPSPELSDAERRVLRLLASHMTLREIGQELYLSHNTVKSHAHSIYRKLGVSSRTDALRIARVTAADDVPAHSAGVGS